MKIHWETTLRCLWNYRLQLIDQYMDYSIILIHFTSSRLTNFWSHQCKAKTKKTFLGNQSKKMIDTATSEAWLEHIQANVVEH